MQAVSQSVCSEPVLLLVERATCKDDLQAIYIIVWGTTSSAASSQHCKLCYPKGTKM